MIDIFKLMPRLFFQPHEIDTESKCACKNCLNTFCYWDTDIIRTDYQCQSGKALFVANVKNVLEGPLTPKHFISGHYVIQDIHCMGCLQSVGWKYLEAQEDENKFKETNYVIEECKVT